LTPPNRTDDPISIHSRQSAPTHLIHLQPPLGLTTHAIMLLQPFPLPFILLRSPYPHAVGIGLRWGDAAVHMMITMMMMMMMTVVLSGDGGGSLGRVHDKDARPPQQQLLLLLLLLLLVVLQLLPLATTITAATTTAVFTSQTSLTHLALFPASQ